VLDLGLTLSPYPSERLGANVPLLIGERGAALNALKRFPDALSDYEDGLTIKNLPALVQARFDRGRGFALTEMGRLDDAGAAFRDALKLDSNDVRSQHELAYIANLRAGRVPVPGTVSTRPPSTPDTPGVTPGPAARPAP